MREIWRTINMKKTKNHEKSGIIENHAPDIVSFCAIKTRFNYE